MSGRQLKALDWYEVSLEQDWTICQLEEWDDCGVTINYHGFLCQYGVPAFRERVGMEHFLSAFYRSPDGDWSREYHPYVRDGLAYGGCYAVSG